MGFHPQAIDYVLPDIVCFFGERLPLLGRDCLPNVILLLSPYAHAIGTARRTHSCYEAKATRRSRRSDKVQVLLLEQ